LGSLYSSLGGATLGNNQPLALPRGLLQSQGPELCLAYDPVFGYVPRHIPRRFPERPYAPRRPLDPCPDPVYVHERVTVFLSMARLLMHSPVPHHVSEHEGGLARDLVRVQVYKRDEVAHYTHS
jgi:hypothetical protein